ncbi:fungal-specific transcription factor domain-containing protein [Lactifluus subvellereus]|nr:fungal-specific transcription factor domain-containing protein [Lactifluus subvellereus]
MESGAPGSNQNVEYKKDGTVSRMRSHRGNVPQLPQTKLCPFCPAKFTRTTHLNRHLRNHTNERLYRCEVCGAQFTRSDLLARHKRSCGESRSRKRSCQACTSLKVKCDLRQPCSKCRTRGRDCIYAIEEGQMEGTGASSSHQEFPNSRFSGPIVSLDASAGFYPSMLGRGAADAFVADFPELSLIEETSNAISQPLSEANLASFVAGAPRIPQGAMSLPTIDADSDVTASSFRVGPNHAFTAFGASEAAAHSRGLHGFSPTMFEPFFRDIFSVKEETSQLNEQGAPPFLHAPDAGTLVAGLGQSDLTQMFLNGMQSLDANLDSGLVFDLMTNTYADNTQAPHSTQEPLPSVMPVPPTRPSPPAPVPNQELIHPSNLIYGFSEPPLYTQKDLEHVILPSPSMDKAPADPSTEEVQHYLHIFCTAFLPQIPVIHTPTLRCELKPPMLLRAMQACGALFVKTAVARAFVEKTLDTCRDFLIREFAKPSPDPRHQIFVIFTLILLQMIGLFHQCPQQRATSNLYHGMLVLMIRQNRLIERNASWQHQSFLTADPTVLETTWNDWAKHEAIKRVVCLAYCHDQAHRIYFSLPPSFSPTEFTMCLPCDDELWTAKTSVEWSQLLLKSSPYGSSEERIYGMPMHRAFAAVGLEGPNMTATPSASPEPPKELSAVSPFGHFILMHTLLGELFRRCSGADSPAASPAPEGEGEEQVNEHVYAMQVALHRWLQMWLKTPNASLNGSPPGETGPGEKATGHFMADPIPFYWLAQLLLLAFQEGIPPFRAPEQPPPACKSEPPNTQGLLEPSPFAPPASSSSPFSPSPFAPSPFSSNALSPASSSATLLTPPPAYRSPSGPPPAPGTHYGNQGASSCATPDTARYYLLKSWLHHIRLFLRRSQGSPTVVWDELMKIRLSGWQGDMSSSQGQFGDAQKNECEEEDSRSWLECDGLIGFFEEKLRI